MLTCYCRLAKTHMENMEMRNVATRNDWEQERRQCFMAMAKTESYMEPDDRDRTIGKLNFICWPCVRRMCLYVNKRDLQSYRENECLQSRLSSFSKRCARFVDLRKGSTVRLVRLNRNSRILFDLLTRQTRYGQWSNVARANRHFTAY